MKFKIQVLIQMLIAIKLTHLAVGHSIVVVLTDFRVLTEIGENFFSASKPMEIKMVLLLRTQHSH